MVTRRFMGLDLVHRGPGELWTEVCDTEQEAVAKTVPKKKKCRKAKSLSEESLQIAEKRRDTQGRRERYAQLNTELQRRARRGKAFLKEQHKEVKGDNMLGELETPSKKLGHFKGTFQPRMGTTEERHNKEQTGRGG